MFKKTSKYLIFSSVLIVFSLLLVSCQSMIATTEEMDRKQAIDAWGDNLTAQGERYLEEMESEGYAYLQASGSLIELTSDVPSDAEVMGMENEGYAYLQASGPLIELTSDVPSESEVMVMESEGHAYLQASGPLIELTSDVPAEAEVMVDTLTIGGENYLERYLEDMTQAGVPVYELKADVPAEAELVVDAFTPGIEIQRTMQSRTIETVYTVMSDGPGWVVFHADKDGVAGAILEYIWVSSGTNSFSRTKILEEMSSEPIHVMLHHDLGWTGYFEFPRTDGPVLVDNEMVDELCFCPF